MLFPPKPEPWHHVGQLVLRLRLEWLLQYMRPRTIWAVYVLLNGFITIALLALLGTVTHSPFAFPSLGTYSLSVLLHPVGGISEPA